MADFDYDALSDLTLTLEAEDGSEVNLEMLYIFEYDDVDYAAFTEQDNPEPVIYFFTLTIGEPAEGEEEAVVAGDFYGTGLNQEELTNKIAQVYQKHKVIETCLEANWFINQDEIVQESNGDIVIEAYRYA